MKLKKCIYTILIIALFIVSYNINSFANEMNYTEVYPNNSIDTRNFKTSDLWYLKFKDVNEINIKSIDFYYNEDYNYHFAIENFNIDTENNKVTFYLSDALIEFLGGKDKLMPSCALELHVIVDKNSYISEASETIFFQGENLIDPYEDSKIGDIDEDGEITSFDAYKALELSISGENLTNEQIKSLDIDKDGEITSFDAYLILSYSVGIVDEKYWNEESENEDQNNDSSSGDESDAKIDFSNKSGYNTLNDVQKELYIKLYEHIDDFNKKVEKLNFENDFLKIFQQTDAIKNLNSNSPTFYEDYQKIIDSDMEKANELLEQVSTTFLEDNKELDFIISIDYEYTYNGMYSNLSAIISYYNETEQENTIYSFPYKYFYNQLNNNEKKLYCKLYDNKDKLIEGNQEVELGDGFLKLIKTENGIGLNRVQTAFYYDNPEVFFGGNLVFSSSYSGNTSSIKASLEINDGFTKQELKQDAKEIENIKKDIISKLSGTTSNKIRQIHDYLVNTITYDNSLSKKGTYTLYGALINKTSVCEGYSNAFQYLANAAGIEAVICTGTTPKGNHAWNAVKIDNKWYYIDVTWDDGVNEDWYYLTGEDDFCLDHTLGSISYFKYPEISKENY